MTRTARSHNSVTMPALLGSSADSVVARSSDGQSESNDAGRLPGRVADTESQGTGTVSFRCAIP